MHRRVVVILATCVGAACASALPVEPARAQDIVARNATSSRRDQINAATDNAVAALREQILREPIGGNATVADLLESSERESDLTSTLRRAELIGGPRWPDDQTCQVRLEISGARVARVLTQIAAASPKKSPVAPDVLAMRLRDWERRTFTSTGTSLGASSVEALRPPAGSEAWEGVGDDERRAALSDARQNAVRRIIESIEPVQLNQGKTVGDVLADPEVRKDLDGWLAERPVTRVLFKERRQVEVTLAAEPDDLFGVFRASVFRRAGLPQDDAQWDGVREAFAQRMAAPTGVASAPGGATVALPHDNVMTTTARAATVQAMDLRVQRDSFAPVALALPARPPEWVGRQLDAGGAVGFADSKLRTTGRARAAAMNDLREQIFHLPLRDGQTVGDAAKDNRRVDRAVSRALARARVYQTQHEP
ncbi:MAG: hypothetical protein ACREIT_07405, partial [Tepidisphaeraceae bacterium]